MADQWYAVRSVIHFGVVDEQRNVFEERIVLFKCEDPEQAFAEAEAEVEDYCKQNQYVDFHANLEMHCLEHSKKNLHGREVWSFLTESSEDLDQYFQARYDDAEYFPEDDEDEEGEDEEGEDEEGEDEEGEDEDDD